MDKITTTLVVLGATVLGMYNSVLVAEMVNKKRDLILDIDEAGERLTVDRKKMLLHSDYVPLTVGLVFFLMIYSAAFYQLPNILEAKYAAAVADDKQIDPAMRPTTAEWWGCKAASTFGAFALAVVVLGNSIEYAKMRLYLKQLAANPQMPRPAVPSMPGWEAAAAVGAFVFVALWLLGLWWIAEMTAAFDSRLERVTANNNSVDGTIEKLEKINALAGGDRPIVDLLADLALIEQAALERAETTRDEANGGAARPDGRDAAAMPPPADPVQP